MQSFNLDPDVIKRLCQQHRFRRLLVFGSVLTTGFRPDSDVDLVVEFELMPLEEYADNYFRFKFALEDLLGRPVDLLEAQASRSTSLATSRTYAPAARPSATWKL